MLKVIGFITKQAPLPLTTATVLWDYICKEPQVFAAWWAGVSRLQIVWALECKEIINFSLSVALLADSGLLFCLEPRVPQANPGCLYDRIQLWESINGKWKPMHSGPHLQRPSQWKHAIPSHLTIGAEQSPAFLCHSLPLTWCKMSK